MNVSIVMTTEHGDLVGRLPLPSVTVGGDEGATIRSTDLSEQISTLYQVIARELGSENFEVALDTVSYHMEVSRCLLEHKSDDDLTITLPVRHIDPADARIEPDLGVPDDNFDDLFLVTVPNGAEEVLHDSASKDA